MNEQIKSLLAKAHLEVKEEFGIIDTNRVAEKFAELIVRECADKAHEFIISDGDEFPLQSVSYRIKQHFGVE